MTCGRRVLKWLRESTIKCWRTSRTGSLWNHGQRQRHHTVRSIIWLLKTWRLNAIARECTRLKKKQNKFRTRLKPKSKNQLTSWRRAKLKTQNANSWFHCAHTKWFGTSFTTMRNRDQNMFWDQKLALRNATSTAVLRNCFRLLSRFLKFWQHSLRRDGKSWETTFWRFSHRRRKTRMQLTKNGLQLNKIEERC